MTTVTVRVDEATKIEASEIVKSFGFDLSTITRAFYRQIVRERCVPLTINEPIPNEKTLEAMKYAQDVFDGKVETDFYDNASDLLKAARE